MSKASRIDFCDDDEAFTATDEADLAAIDPEKLERLGELFDDLMGVPEGDERNMATLGVLHEMYGDELVVL